MVSPDLEITTIPVFFKLIFLTKLLIECSSTFSKKCIFGNLSLTKKLFFIDTNVLPPRLDPPVPKKSNCSNFAEKKRCN